MKHTYLCPTTAVCPIGVQRMLMNSNTTKSSAINTTAVIGVRGDAPARLGGSYL